MPACTRLTSAAQGDGRSAWLCRYHAQRKNRIGSTWHPNYRANELRPYLVAASSWLTVSSGSPAVEEARTNVDRALAFAGPVDPATNLRGQSAAYRARVAFARLREAGIPAERLLAIYLCVSALIEDDRGSHRSREFRIVQAAKATHRLASGTHKRWQMWNPLGEPVQAELHVYPRSSGLVLRKMGEKLDEAADSLAQSAVPEIIELKTSRFGPHPSHLPEWRPVWASQPSEERNLGQSGG